MMRRTGKLGFEILNKLEQVIAPGVTTAELNEIARLELEKAGAVGTSKNYPTYKPGEGYPAEMCISVNEEVVHGIPTVKRVLREGDIVTLDLALMLGGYCADMARTLPVGRIGSVAQKLLDVTKQDGNRLCFRAALGEIELVKGRWPVESSSNAVNRVSWSGDDVASRKQLCRCVNTCLVGRQHNWSRASH